MFQAPGTGSLFQFCLGQDLSVYMILRTLYWFTQIKEYGRLKKQAQQERLFSSLGEADYPIVRSIHKFLQEPIHKFGHIHIHIHVHVQLMVKAPQLENTTRAGYASL